MGKRKSYGKRKRQQEKTRYRFPYRPRTLRAAKMVTMTASYDDMITGLARGLDLPVQDITVYYGPGILMSGVGTIYPADQIREFRGYISSFEPAGFTDGSDGPSATVTIQPVTDEQEGE